MELKVFDTVLIILDQKISQNNKNMRFHNNIDDWGGLLDTKGIAKNIDKNNQRCRKNAIMIFTRLWDHDDSSWTSGRGSDSFHEVNMALSIWFGYLRRQLSSLISSRKPT